MSSVASAIEILQCFSPNSPQLKVSDVAARLGMPKSTVSRLMKTMREGGLLDQDGESRQYVPGQLAFRLGSLYLANFKVLEQADRAVMELVSEFGMTGYVGVLSGSDVIILRARQGSYPVQVVLGQGQRIPAFVTAMGRMLLARLEDDDVRRLYPAELFYKRTMIRMHIDQLLADLHHLRNRQWVEALETTFAGIGAIAVAVEGGPGEQTIGFGLSFPVHAVNETQHQAIVERLLEAASRIESHLGDPFRAGAPGFGPAGGRADGPAWSTLGRKAALAD
jgi:IclR family transcriptional regulator, acetate operon repressor